MFLINFMNIKLLCWLKYSQNIRHLSLCLQVGYMQVHEVMHLKIGLLCPQTCIGCANRCISGFLADITYLWKLHPFNTYYHIFTVQNFNPCIYFRTVNDVFHECANQVMVVWFLLHWLSRVILDGLVIKYLQFRFLCKKTLTNVVMVSRGGRKFFHYWTVVSTRRCYYLHWRRRGWGYHLSTCGSTQWRSQPVNAARARLNCDTVSCHLPKEIILLTID